MSLSDETRTEWRARAERTLSLADEWRKKGFPPDVATVELARAILALLDEIDQLRAEHAWPKVTPTGHTYSRPTTYDELRGFHNDVALACVEHWDASECPPEPVWEMVGLAHKEIDRLRSELEVAETVTDFADGAYIDAQQHRRSAEAAVDRVRELADELASAPMVGATGEEQWELNTERRIGRELLAALDGEA